MLLFNSLTRKVAKFQPRHPKKVTIYVCGITPYDTTHLGHAFTYISFDVLIRYLKFEGFKVIYTQNVTDINDRDKDILEKAKKQSVPWEKLSQYWTQKFLEDMKTLNWTPPTYYLKASDNIPSVINLIKKLLKKGLAYQKNGSVFLDITKNKDYGKLSGLNKKDTLTVAKEFEEDINNPDKLQPLDVTLWRATEPNQEPHIPSFPSPFGQGRPGWHIECSAMSMKHMGDQIDIHGGGIDLIFPHHEAEIAQSEGATGKIPFAKYWLHTGQVFYRRQKMSKSLGNLVMVSDILKQYSPNTLRWLILSHHWSKNWEFREMDLVQAQREVEIVETTIHALATKGETLEPKYLKQFNKFMDQNLNTPKVLDFFLKLASQEAKDLKKFYNILGFK